MDDLLFRQTIHPPDPDAIERIVRQSGFFSTAEIGIARELASDALTHGTGSDYRFLIALSAGELAGYTCYGPIPATVGSYDLYWIVVDSEIRGQGLGQTLLRKTEAIIFSAGGLALYAETSSRDQYAPTRAFYERCGYAAEACLKDFYAPHDSKIIYSKALSI